MPYSGLLIREWAEKHFQGPPNAIVLTHGHFDHAGGVRSLADEWNVPVYAHPLEFPFLTGRESYPPPDPGVGGGVMPLLSPLFPRSPYDISDRLRPIAGESLEAGALVAGLGQGCCPHLVEEPLHGPGRLGHGVAEAELGESAVAEGARPLGPVPYTHLTPPTPPSV